MMFLPPAARSFTLRAMNLINERSRGEIILFAAGIFGIWLSIWAVVLLSATLEVVAVLTTLVALVIFALRAGD